MYLNRKIDFKMPSEKFKEPDLVDMDSFTRSNLKSLNIKPNLHYWALYIGKKDKKMFQYIKYRTSKSEDGY